MNRVPLVVIGLAVVATVLKSGTFEGKTDHDVSGRVELLERVGTLYLRFVDYERTQ